MIEQLTAVATNATIGIGSSRLISPSGPRWVRKRWLKCVANASTLVKKTSWMTLTMRGFQYGFERHRRPFDATGYI